MAEPTKAELQAELIETKQMYEDVVSKAEHYEQEAKELQVKLETMEAEMNDNQSALGVVKCILELTEAERKLLPIYVRTNEQGIKAFNVFNYGSSGETILKDDPHKEAMQKA